MFLCSLIRENSVRLSDRHPNSHESGYSEETAPRVQNGSFLSAGRLVRQITCTLHARYLIGFQVVLVAIVLKPTTVQNLPISPVTLIGNGRLPTFIGQQNELLFGMVVHDLVCCSLEQA